MFKKTADLVKVGTPKGGRLIESRPTSRKQLLTELKIIFVLMIAINPLKCNTYLVKIFQRKAFKMNFTFLVERNFYAVRHFVSMPLCICRLRCFLSGIP